VDVTEGDGDGEAAVGIGDVALGVGWVVPEGLDEVQAESRMAAKHPTTSDDEDVMDSLLPFTPP